MKNNQTVTAMVVLVLGCLALATVIGGIILAAEDKSLPGELIAIGASAAGAIGGILAKTSATDDVRVVNEANDPVPVEGA